MSLYASKLILSPRAKRRLHIEDRYSLHRLLLDLLPVESKQRILWADDGEHLSGRVLHLLSNADLSNIIVAEDIRFECRKIPDEFFEQNNYRFSINVNPTVKKNGKNLAIRTPQQIEQWALDRFSKNGMVAEIQSLRSPNVVRFTRKNEEIVFFEVRLEGVLSVKDREKFINSVSQGMGRSKAFGCGMLQLALI